MVDEQSRREEARQEAQEIRLLWHMLTPGLVTFFTVAIFVLLKLLLDTFISWTAIIGYSLLVAALSFGIGGFVYWVRKNKKVEVSEAIPYLKPEEFTQYCIDAMKREKNHPINMRIYEGRRKLARTKSVGGMGAAATEVYVRKFYDADLTNTDIYYFFARVNQPDTLSYESRHYEPTEEEEERLIERCANDVALTPSKFRDTKIIVNNPITGVEQTTLLREPVETRVNAPVRESPKEEIEEN